MTKLAAIPIDTFVFIVLVSDREFFSLDYKTSGRGKTQLGLGFDAVDSAKNTPHARKPTRQRVRRVLEALGQPGLLGASARLSKSARKNQSNGASLFRKAAPFSRRCLR